ncbi:sensor histidine kinase [Tenacibaculum crassostreae]|uniref:sensor histidine kinase n=1 Tax=Tenacibaculum crassostreae TaxID=502683 RepID=UPI0038940DD5
MKKIAYIFCFFCFAFGFTSYAQHPLYTHLTEKDGLPDIEFYDIVEDKEGFIWLAADKGLIRYDGKEFKNYSHPEKRGLSVFGLELDINNRLWCNNISGQFFYVENDSLRLFKDLKKEVKGQLASFLFYKENLVVSAETGVYSFDLKTNDREKLFEKRELGYPLLVKNDTLFNLHDDIIKASKKDTVGILKYDLKKYKKYRFNRKMISSFNEKLLVYSFDTDNKKKKPVLLYEIGGKLKEVQLPKELLETDIVRFYENEDDLWICTHNGIYVYGLNGTTLLYKNVYFKNKVISGFLKDRNNNYWISTLRNGVYIIPNLHIENYEIDEDKMNISAMKSIGKDSLILGSTKGDVGIVNTSSKKINFFKTNYKDKVYSICNYKDRVYLSLGRQSLVYNKQTKRIHKEEFCNNAKDLSVLNDDNILYAAHSSASIINLKTKEKHSLRRARSYTTHFDKENMYVGYVDGLMKYNKKREESKILFKNKPIFAIDIDETNNGIIWVATFKDGVVGIKDGVAITNYTTKNGLLSNQINKIKGDGESLWIATDKGLQALNVNTQKFKNLSRKDGLSSFNISEIVPLEDNVFFSSNKGLFKIDKNKAFKSSNIFDFYFTSILVDDKEVQENKSYSLNPQNKKIQFNFHTNGYLSEDNITYYYKLEEANKKEKWSIVSKGVNQVTFNNLAAGKYVFKLKGVQHNGKKETTVKTIELTVKPPFYKEWWFIMLAIVSLFSFLWVYFSNRIKKLKIKQREAVEKERMQKQLVASKLESLQSQMNPHFTFNALNSIQNLILKGDKFEAYDYLTKFSLLIRENLNMSKKSFVTFDEELKMLIKYLDLEKLRFRDRFEYEVVIVNDISDIKIPTMIIQPYVENAVKHGLLNKEVGERKLKLSFEKTDVLRCTVEDNGVGVEKAQKIKESKNKSRKSFSTSAIQDRMKFLKDYYKTDIGVTYEKVEVGTKVIIKIPYTKL